MPSLPKALQQAQVCLCLTQNLDDLVQTAHDGNVQGRLLFRIHGVRVCSVLEQDSHQARVEGHLLACVLGGLRAVVQQLHRLMQGRGTGAR